MDVSNPRNFLFSEEFSLILSMYRYSPKNLEETMELCRDSTGYALTGAIFSQDKTFTSYFQEKMKYTCGNFYINDKSTGSVVGQQPFGGSGKSGTNDKAGNINFIYPNESKKCKRVSTLKNNCFIIFIFFSKNHDCVPKPW